MEISRSLTARHQLPSELLHTSELEGWLPALPLTSGLLSPADPGEAASSPEKAGVCSWIASPRAQLLGSYPRTLDRELI